MCVVFLSNLDDSVLYGVYEHLAQRYPCRYVMNEGEADALDPSIIITNYCIGHKPNKKIVFYSTDGDIPTDLARRRLMLSWLKSCDVVCASWAMAKIFYDTLRIKPSVQHPYVPELPRNQFAIVYSNSFGNMDAVQNELPGEQFIDYQQPSDVTDAKVYLAASSSFVDMGLCVASACGVPVVLENSPYLREFLENGDVIVDTNLPLNLKIQAIKKSLKECDKLKTRSRRFIQTPAIEDKIRQALAKKPTTREIIPPAKVNNSMSGVRRPRPEPDRHYNLKPLTDTTIYISGSVVGISGYDNLVYEVIKGLKSLNVDVRINSYNAINQGICPSYFKEIQTLRTMDAWEIIIVPPCSLDRQGQAVSKKSILFTMWETDHLEPAWVKQINQAAFVMVPSQWSVESFRKSGVTIPIHKVPLGFDPLVFNQDGAYPRECVFGTAAALSAGGLRKNTSHIVHLFQKAFPDNEKVKLKVKITPSCPWEEIGDSRVEVTKTYLKPLELASWYRSISAFVNGSYAEGFGLHLIETMACGRPIISTHYSAVTEYFDDAVGYIVNHEIIPASGCAYSGHWGRPVEESVIHWMRHVYRNKEEALQKGEKAALRAKQYTWKCMGTKLVQILKNNGVLNI